MKYLIPPLLLGLILMGFYIDHQEAKIRDLEFRLIGQTVSAERAIQELQMEVYRLENKLGWGRKK